MRRRQSQISIAGFAVRMIFPDSAIGRAAGLKNRAIGRADAILEIRRSSRLHIGRVPADQRLEGYGEYRGKFDVRSRQGAVVLTGASEMVSLASCLRQVCARLVQADGGVVLHAAAVAQRGHADIFFGPSGAGKTTLCRLSRGRTILGDELVAVRRVNGKFLVWGLPTAHPLKPARSKGMPVRAIFRLVQAKRNGLKRLSGAKAVAQLAVVPPAQFCRTRDVKNMLTLAGKLVENVPVYELRFRKDATFWISIEREWKREKEGI